MSQGRYERKYMLTENSALAIRRFVKAYLPPDEHMSGADVEGYYVHSLYLDSPQCELYRRSVANDKNRYKLRIRFYDLSENGPAFLEIKRRLGDSIHKQRAAISKQAALKLLHGQTLGSADLLSQSDASARALAEFGDLRDRLGASGMVYVHYRREAYAANSADGTRVTFDRYVAAEPYQLNHGLISDGHQIPLQPSCVVLELKHFGHAPHWLCDLASTFGLRRTAFPKYIRCFDTLHRAHRLGTPVLAQLIPNGDYLRELA